MEKQRSLDLPPIRQNARPKGMRTKYDPSAAFGPPGSTGEDNISVIIAPIQDGFRIENLGSPETAAQKLLDATIAPPGGDKKAELLNSSSRVTELGDLLYSLEFTVEKVGAWKRHNVAVIGAQDNILYTFNAQCAEARWDQYWEKYIPAAESFKLIPLSSQPNFSESP